MLKSNEILVKDMEFRECIDEKLFKVIEEYGNEYKVIKSKKRCYIYVELMILLGLTILDFCKINVTILLGAMCIVLFFQYLKWGFSKLTKMYQHYDVNMFFKDMKDGITYEEVICDDIAFENKAAYVALISTLDEKNVMEKIRVPYVENMSMEFDRKAESDKPHMFLVKSGIVYFAIESLDADWWSKNIQKILK
jgi:hypothetical protein